MNNIKASASSSLEWNINRGSKLIFNSLVLREVVKFELHYPPPVCVEDFSRTEGNAHRILFDRFTSVCLSEL